MTSEKPDQKCTRVERGRVWNILAMGVHDLKSSKKGDPVFLGFIEFLLTSFFRK